VREVVSERGRVVLQTTCAVRGVMVIDGEALIKVDSSVRRANKAASVAALQATA
jgi:3-hydroxybutyryl-CoA dehydratase